MRINSCCKRCGWYYSGFDLASVGDAGVNAAGYYREGGLILFRGRCAAEQLNGAGVDDHQRGYHKFEGGHGLMRHRLQLAGGGAEHDPHGVGRALLTSRGCVCAGGLSVADVPFVPEQ